MLQVEFICVIIDGIGRILCKNINIKEYYKTFTDSRMIIKFIRWGGVLRFQF